MTREEFESYGSFIQNLGSAFLESGCSTHRLESRLSNVCETLGFHSELFVVPSAIFLSLRKGHHKNTYFLRIKRLGLNLITLQNLSDFCTRISQQKLPLDIAQEELEQILTSQEFYPTWLVLISQFFISGLFFYFIGGELKHSIFAGFLGVICERVESYCSKSIHPAFVSNFLSALLLSFLSCIYAHFFPETNIGKFVLAGVIIIVPGLSLTNAIAELIHKQYLSGSSKVVEAVLVMLSIAFGLYLPLTIFGVFS